MMTAVSGVDSCGAVILVAVIMPVVAISISKFLTWIVLQVSPISDRFTRRMRDGYECGITTDKNGTTHMDKLQFVSEFWDLIPMFIVAELASILLLVLCCHYVSSPSSYGKTLQKITISLLVSFILMISRSFFCRKVTNKF
jgi:NADH:ubiquinone oxidoreductase subunit 3 (subunit A)